MADKSLREYLVDVADAIRSKTSTQDKMTIQEMPEKIESISGGGVDPDDIYTFANKLVNISLSIGVYDVANQYYILNVPSPINPVEVFENGVLTPASATFDFDYKTKPSFKFVCDYKQYIVTDYTVVENGVTNLVSIRSNDINATDTHEFTSLIIERDTGDPRLILTPYGQRWDNGLTVIMSESGPAIQLNNQSPIALTERNIIKLCDTEKYVWDSDEELTNGVYFSSGFFLVHNGERSTVEVGSYGKFYYQNEDLTLGEEVPLEYIGRRIHDYVFNFTDTFTCMWNIQGM